MLRVFQSKIFREDLKDFSIPTLSFRKFEDVENKVDFSNGTYKFCLPLSVGDFPEAKVPPCFSNDKEEIREFVEMQQQKNKRKAFMILDLGISNLEDMEYSGVISTYSDKGLTNYYDLSTSISLSLKNPILTAMNEGISPRDLPADVFLNYEHVFSPNASFPKVKITNENANLEELKDIIYQAYVASLGVHEVGQKYDGDNYEEHVLFFTDKSKNVWMYDMIGKMSFLQEEEADAKKINQELDYVYTVPDIEKPKEFTLKKETEQLN